MKVTIRTKHTQKQTMKVKIRRRKKHTHRENNQTMKLQYEKKLKQTTMRVVHVPGN